MEPAVDAIGSTIASFAIKRLPGFDRVLVGIDCAGTVVRVVSVADRSVLHLLSRLAEIFQDLAADVFELACRIPGGHKPGNVVHDQA
jgi:hypothetical protein